MVDILPRSLLRSWQVPLMQSRSALGAPQISRDLPRGDLERRRTAGIRGHRATAATLAAQAGTTAVKRPTMVSPAPDMTVRPMAIPVRARQPREFGEPSGVDYAGGGGGGGVSGKGGDGGASGGVGGARNGSTGENGANGSPIEGIGGKGGNGGTSGGGGGGGNYGGGGGGAGSDGGMHGGGAGGQGICIIRNHREEKTV